MHVQLYFSPYTWWLQFGVWNGNFPLVESFLQPQCCECGPRIGCCASKSLQLARLRIGTAALWSLPLLHATKGLFRRDFLSNHPHNEDCQRCTKTRPRDSFVWFYANDALFIWVVPGSRPGVCCHCHLFGEWRTLPSSGLRSFCHLRLRSAFRKRLPDVGWVINLLLIACQETFEKTKQIEFWSRLDLRQDLVRPQFVYRFVHDVCRSPILSAGNVPRRLCDFLLHLLRGSR